MRHQNRVAKLGRTASHRKALMMNLASALIQHGKIKTTDAKAKELRRYVERLITYGKRGTVHHRRLAFKVLHDRTVVKTLFDHIAPQYSDRDGGYTRIIKLGFRDNDCAAVSLIEFVDYRQPGEKKSAKPAKKTTTTKKTKPETTKTVKERKVKKVDEPTEQEESVTEPVVEEKPVEEPVVEEAEETEKKPAE
ncbi:50S ribosomal protein L17 [bacterium]|nr:50S ribosomal protein L17 [bacterium]MBU1063300.1 50S ribosomal protein L17 [bacterium]MBU1634795.1 50S ribosomal protein L17 [bacterium]MBU1874036.1 50S ribosomal protein L17 [bacterium]